MSIEIPKTDEELQDQILKEMSSGQHGPSESDLLMEALDDNPEDGGSGIITKLSDAFSMDGIFGDWLETNKDAAIDTFAEGVSHMAVRTVQYSIVGLVPGDCAAGKILRSKFMDAMLYASLSQGVALGSSMLTGAHPKFQYLGGAAARLSMRHSIGALNLAKRFGKFNPILRRFFD